MLKAQLGNIYGNNKVCLRVYVELSPLTSRGNFAIFFQLSGYNPTMKVTIILSLELIIGGNQIITKKTTANYNKCGKIYYEDTHDLKV